MRRREFIKSIGGAAIAWPLSARAQQGERMRRIGVLMNLASDDAEGQARLAAFHQGLQQLGWTVGHNVRIGRGCLFASGVGVSGSTVIGDGVRFGGQVGIADHLHIGDGASLMARSGLMHDMPPRETWGGAPAMPARQWLRQSRFNRGTIVWLVFFQARRTQARFSSARSSSHQ